MNTIKAVAILLLLVVVSLLCREAEEREKFCTKKGGKMMLSPSKKSGCMILDRESRISKVDTSLSARRRDEAKKRQ